MRKLLNQIKNIFRKKKSKTQFILENRELFFEINDVFSKVGQFLSENKEIDTLTIKRINHIEERMKYLNDSF